MTPATAATLGILADTPTHRIEADRYPGHGWMLSIVDKATGHCKAIAGRRVIGEYRENRATAGSDAEVVRVYLRMFRGLEWKPCYKAGVLLKQEVEG